MPRVHSLVQTGDGWIASPTEEVEVKAKVVAPPEKRAAPRKSTGVETKDI